MKRIYVQPYLTIVEMESGSMMASSAGDNDLIPLEPDNPADKMESKRRETFWGRAGVWK